MALRRAHNRKDIPEGKLRELLDLDFNITQIAAWFAVHPKTISRRLKELDWNVQEDKEYSQISEEQLLNIMLDIIKSKPKIGVVLAWQHLKEVLHLKVQRWRVRKALSDIMGDDPRRNKPVKRREYRVRAPLSMAHIDTHHKLVRWRIVVIGVVDGYSRKLTTLKLATNNKAITVFDHVLEGWQANGVPSRARFDYGKENLGVALFLTLYRGNERSSIITGSSVHNTRIERMWRDVFRVALKAFYDLFYKLEEQQILDHTCNVDLFALHYVFFPIIAKNVEDFKATWNGHRMRNEGFSPNQLFTIGIENLERESKKTGKIFTELLQPEIEEDLIQEIRTDCLKNNHEGLHVPLLSCPISTQQMTELQHAFPVDGLN